MIKIEETADRCPLCGAQLAPVLHTNKGSMDCPKCRKALWFRSKETRDAPGHEGQDRTVTYYRLIEKPGKNSRCPCGSGHAYVRCCGRPRK